MRIGLIITFVALYFSGYGGTGDQYLSRFSVDGVDKTVLIQFTTSHGFSCEDIRILGGTDSNNLGQIHLFPGLCGSEDKEEHYRYIWETPALNQTIYVQIDLGIFGKSRILQINVESIKTNASQVIPNPVSSESRLYFSIDQADKAHIIIYNTLMSSVMEQDDVSSGELSFGDLNLPVGTYYYVLTVDQFILRGRFEVVQ